MKVILRATSACRPTHHLPAYQTIDLAGECHLNGLIQSVYLSAANDNVESIYLLLVAERWSFLSVDKECRIGDALHATQPQQNGMSLI